MIGEMAMESDSDSQEEPLCAMAKCHSCATQRSRTDLGLRTILRAFVSITSILGSTLGVSAHLGAVTWTILGFPLGATWLALLVTLLLAAFLMWLRLLLRCSTEVVGRLKGARSRNALATGTPDDGETQA